jgi:hypothetical protein
MKTGFDDDENVKAMRETARSIGLTDLLVKVSQTNDAGAAKELLRKALQLLGQENRK